MLSKQQQAGRYSRKKTTDGVTSEAPLQNQLNDMLAVLNIWQIRIPDGFFRWLKMKAPPGVQKWFFGVFGGIPDSLPLIRVSDKYMLCAPIELKSAKGRRHGKQKHWEEKGIAFQLSRDPDTSIAIVEQFRKDAEKVAQYLTLHHDAQESSGSHPQSDRPSTLK